MEKSKKFNAVICEEGKSSVKEVERRDLQEGEVLIRVEACPINPSDQFMAMGVYGVRELMNEGPLGIGFEGAGVVVEVRLIIRKRFNFDLGP